MRSLLYLAFLLSGVAGLLYEIVWSRYLAIFLGHSAYAQVLVIATYLGGLAVGALLAGERSRRLERPLLWYVRAEVALAAFGAAFHFLFQGVTGLAYGVLLPGSSELVGHVLRWSLSLGLILPAAVVLGTTFPLMAAGLLRLEEESPGRTVADLYFFNSVGAAAGALIGGFALIAWVGLPGTAVGAVILNGAAAWLAFGVARSSGGESPAPAPSEGVEEAGPSAPDEVSDAVRALWPGLLAVAFGTAVASFIYQIAWIRMLSLVMGSANHSFEIMLSAFILGLALGARLVRGLADSTRRPLRLLGMIQWLMGLAALATLPLYLVSFEVVAAMVSDLPRTAQGYALFSVGRYGVALAVMLPSTILAGMTLPLITAILLRAGAGERAVGWVYGLNTLGSVSGVVLAGLILMPLVGLKNMLMVGGGLDMVLGVFLLAWASRRGEGLEPDYDIRSLVRSPQLAVLTLVVLAGVGYGISLRQAVLTSGVFRHGRTAEEGRPVLFYEDGLTASVGVHAEGNPPLFILTTNGKADASLSARWLESATRAMEPEPIRYQDESTQVLAPLVALAHAPGAESAFVLGQGSGLSGHFILGSPELEAAVTVEIEPQMINGSQSFYPTNRRVFDDPRHAFVIGDAKAWLAGTGRSFDVIFSEPSNPWVSGVASLFTEEFYERVVDHLTPGGVFAQWIQLYELNDRLFLSVLAAIHGVFPEYEAYLVGDTDLLVLASTRPLSEPDWSIFGWPAVSDDLAHLPPFRPGQLDALWLFDRAAVEPLLARPQPVNSVYRPVLDLGTERARFFQQVAEGVYGLAVDRFDVAGALTARRAGFGSAELPPAPRLAPMRDQHRSAVLRGEPGSGARSVPDDWPGRESLDRLFSNYALFMGLLAANRPPGSWAGWVDAFSTVERAIHAQTAGVADEGFYERVGRFLDGADAPDEVRAAVDFHHGLAAWDFDEAARASYALEARASEIRVPPELLLDGGVVARLKTGDAGAARRLYRALEEEVDRRPGDFRMQLLDAWIREAETR